MREGQRQESGTLPHFLCTYYLMTMLVKVAADLLSEFLLSDALQVLLPGLLPHDSGQGVKESLGQGWGSYLNSSTEQQGSQWPSRKD